MSRLGESGNDPDAGGANIGDAAQKVTENLRELGGQVREAAKEKYEQYTEQARGYYEQGRGTAEGWEGEIEAFVHEQPVQALLLAAGIGLLVGLMWRH